MRPPLLGLFIPSKTDSVRVKTLEASLDLRQLRYFVAVAELENVGRAATVLNISQSPLSRQIQQLEAQLGLDLFERERKRLRLTAEGRQFLDEARDLLAHAERLEMHSKLLGRGVEGRLAIGYVEGAVHSGLIARALAELRGKLPGLQLHLVSMRSFAQIEGLRSRSIDVALLYTPPSPPDPDIEVRLVLDEPLLLAVPAGDPLADAGTIGPADLDGRVWITVVRLPRDTTRDQFVAAAALAGFTPEIVYETADPLTSLGLVGAGLGLAVAQASLRSAAPAGVVFREIPWFKRSVRVYLAWRKADRRKAVEAFRRCVIHDDRDGR